MSVLKPIWEVAGLTMERSRVSLSALGFLGLIRKVLLSKALTRKSGGFWVMRLGLAGLRGKVGLSPVKSRYVALTRVKNLWSVSGWGRFQFMVAFQRIAEWRASNGRIGRWMSVNVGGCRWMAVKIFYTEALNG